jgi:hypothetical protein
MNELEKTRAAMAAGARFAYVGVITAQGECRIGIAVEGEPGYNQVREDSDVGGTYETIDAAQKVADVYNERRGIDAEEAHKIVISTMGPGGVQR